MFNSFGSLFRVTTFGESHGSGLGCVVDGCPAGVSLNRDSLLKQLERRRPGQSAITTGRKESDAPEILSGLYDGTTLGTPIAMVVRNTGQRSSDYDQIKKQPRKGHADKTWRDKFGHVDHRGGGRASGRETVGRVMAGWVAEGLLAELFSDLTITAHVSRVGDLKIPEDHEDRTWSREEVDRYACRCPVENTALEIDRMLLAAKKEGQSYGGTVTVTIRNLPQGLGEPVFLKAQNMLAGAFSSIGTVNGVTWNEKPLTLPGTAFHENNQYGGLNGGITNGADLRFRVVCKPVSTLGDLAKAGRHDPCVLPRIVPVVESMAALVLADLALMAKVRSV
jgi:chorismate synthase